MTAIHEFLRRPFDRFSEWRLRRAYARLQKTSSEFDAALERLAEAAAEFSKFAEDFGQMVAEWEASMPQYQEGGSATTDHRLVALPDQHMTKEK